jgi:hypothetical protein
MVSRRSFWVCSRPSCQREQKLIFDDSLVGPTFPITIAQSHTDLRYTPDMFSVSRPEQISKSSLAHLQSSLHSLTDETKCSPLKQLLSTPLKPTNQPTGSSMGFFDQGILTGIVAFVLPTLGLAGYLTYRLLAYGLRPYW